MKFATVCLAFISFVSQALGLAVAQTTDESTSLPLASSAKKSEPSTAGVDATLWAPRKLTMRFGLEFNTNDNYCTGLKATVPFPTDWPEQKVKLINADMPPTARYTMRQISGGAQQLVIEAPKLDPKTQMRAIVTVEIEKSFIKAPEDPSSLTIPKPVPKELRWYMDNSPYIEADSGEVKKVAKQIKEGQPENAWAQVEAIFDWVRKNIEYKSGEIRTTREAMKDKSGDCEEMTSIFVAICRASGIPARCVWVPDHCYPEFYLVDAKGDGHWYPCQVAGDRQFGEINEYRPILQKGDRFKVPEKKAMQRYVSEYLTCNQKVLGPIKPKAKTIRDLGELQAEINALQANRRGPAKAGQLEIDDGSEK